MSPKRRLRIRVDGGTVEFVDNEIDNTTVTMMAIHNKAKSLGIKYDMEEHGLSLMASTFCG